MLDWSIASLFAVLSGSSSALARFMTSPRRTLAARLGANGFAILHYLMLGQLAGMLGNGLAALRNAAGAFLPKRPMILLTWCSVGAMGLLTVYEGGAAFLALLSLVVMGISNHYRDRPILFYSLFALGEVFWLVYGIAVGSGLVPFYVLSIVLILVIPLRKAIQADRMSA